MAVPINIPVIARIMDPADRIPIYVQISSGDTTTDTLLSNEEIVDYTVSVGADAALYGLTILNTPPYNVQLSGNTSVQWLEIDELRRTDIVFSGSGIVLAVEITIITSLGRRLQFSVGIQVRQK